MKTLNLERTFAVIQWLLKTKFAHKNSHNWKRTITSLFIHIDRIMIVPMKRCLNQFMSIIIRWWAQIIQVEIFSIHVHIQAKAQVQAPVALLRVLRLHPVLNNLKIILQVLKLKKQLKVRISTKKKVQEKKVWLNILQNLLTNC